MAETAADILVGVLEDWGVDVIFGIPGGSFQSPFSSEWPNRR